MQHVLPVARSLRTLYALSSDRLWVALAVLGALVVAAELAAFALIGNLPVIEGGFGL